MALDPYSPCPCGSGKKFKWCCQPIHIQLNKAFEQEAEGQHEAALRMVDEIIAQHPTNPEVWGRKAELLYQNGRFEEAENALQKALEINPRYPFGHLLRGMFRLNEGEMGGAVLLFRKAAELYDPEAHDYLALLYSRIGESELKMNRPVAARAALVQAIHHQPASEDLRQGIEEVFGDKSRLPVAARKEYTFLSPAAVAAPAQRAAWDRALEGSAGRRLSDAARAFQQLTAEDPQDAAAWYNLGLVQAWQGDNRNAIEALDRYVSLEADEGKAADAWSLAEALRCGQGMEDEADYHEHSALYQLRNPQQVLGFLRKWEAEMRLIGLQVSQEQGIVTGLILDQVTALTVQSASAQASPLAAYIMLIADHLRLWGTNAEALVRVGQELKQNVGPALSEARLDRGPVNFHDILLEAYAFPIKIADNDEAHRRVLAHQERFFEEKWIHRPLHSLGMVPPIDGAGHPTLRKKLLGVVQFLQDAAALGQAKVYDFDRLRRKLGLLTEVKAAPAAPGTPSLDIGAMGAAELANLATESLEDEVLDQAYQAAMKLDARDLAGRFARALVARPAHADRPDRYPWYAHLVQQALGEGDTDAALNYLNEGEKADCEHNEGRRRNDYELRRGQIHARRGNVDEAQGIFERLIDRVPSEVRYRGSAAEAMLSARQGGRALRFAEGGLAKAREKNDRDSEQYFLELANAARKQGG